jgi:acyl phosphate:glycerol-3-phosphate acyltransferase
MMPLLLRLFCCFVAGSIPFAVLSMIGTGVDIRKVGSGNPGFNNVLRVSKVRAVVALVGDMGKGFLAVWLVLSVWPIRSVQAGVPLWLGSATSPAVLGWLCGFAAVFGHCFSPFLRFNGGKGVATSGGVMLVLYPVWAVIALAYFTVARITAGKLKWREAGTIASLTTWVLFTVLMLGFVGRPDAVFAVLMTLFLTWRHKKNLQKLLARSAVTDGEVRGAGHREVDPSLRSG